MVEAYIEKQNLTFDDARNYCAGRRGWGYDLAVGFNLAELHALTKAAKQNEMQEGTDMINESLKYKLLFQLCKNTESKLKVGDNKSLFHWLFFDEQKQLKSKSFLQYGSSRVRKNFDTSKKLLHGHWIENSINLLAENKSDLAPYKAL